MFLIINLMSLLASNLIFSQALGASTIFISAKNKTNFIGVALAITFFTTLGSVVAYFTEGLFTGFFEYFRLFVYVLIIGLIYIISLISLYFINKNFFEKFSKYIHIASFNCAVIGSLLMINGNVIGNSLTSYLIFGLQTGFGYILASLIMASAFKRLNSVKVPRSFRGIPAMLIYIGLFSMAIWSLK